MSLVNKGIALGDLGQGEEAVEVFDDVVGPSARHRVAAASRSR
jgi:hypothetical protein